MIIKGELFRHDDQPAHECNECALRIQELEEAREGQERALDEQTRRISELEAREAVQEVVE